MAVNAAPMRADKNRCECAVQIAANIGGDLPVVVREIEHVTIVGRFSCVAHVSRGVERTDLAILYIWTLSFRLDEGTDLIPTVSIPSK